MPEEELLTTGAAAAILGVSDETVRRWADDKLIRHIRLPGGRRRFRRADIDAVLTPVEPDEAAFVTAVATPVDALVEQLRAAGSDVIVEVLPAGGALVVDQARFDAVKRECSDRAADRRRRMMERHGALLDDQLADLRLMRWAEEEHLLAAPGWAAHPARTKGVRL